MNINQEISIKSFVVTAYICRVENVTVRYLIIERNSKYLNGEW